MLSGKCQPFCLGLNVLKPFRHVDHTMNSITSTKPKVSMSQKGCYKISYTFWYYNSTSMNFCMYKSIPMTKCTSECTRGSNKSKMKSRWRHQMETFSTSLAICEGNPPGTGGFPSQRPVMWSFDVFFDLCLNNWLSIQSRCWWFEMPLCSLWCHCNVIIGA